MRRIAVLNQKGGCAKTTTSLCLAVGAAGRGLNTLLIDTDSQANATLTLTEGQGSDPPSLGSVLLGSSNASDAIRPTRVKRLDLLPADARLADASLLLADKVGRETRLRVALDTLADRYDLVIADCSPGMSLITVNVLSAVSEIIVPVDAGLYAVAGLAELQRVVSDVRTFLGNSVLRIAGLLVTRTHHNKATRDIIEQLRQAYGDLVFKATIPHSVRVEEAHARNLTILEFDPKSAPAKAYADLLTEVIGHGKQQRRSNSVGSHSSPAA